MALKKFRLHRQKSCVSSYITSDGRWTIWREENTGYGSRWYVNDEQLDETENSDGFERKCDAVEYLHTVYGRPDW